LIRPPVLIGAIPADGLRRRIYHKIGFSSCVDDVAATIVIEKGVGQGIVRKNGFHSWAEGPLNEPDCDEAIITRIIDEKALTASIVSEKGLTKDRIFDHILATMLHLSLIPGLASSAAPEDKFMIIDKAVMDTI